MGFIKTAGIGLGALFLIGACMGGNDEDAAPEKDEPAASSNKVDDAIEEITDDSQPTQHDIWRDNHDAHEKSIQRALTRRLPAYQQPIDTANEALASCDEIAAGTQLAKRLENAGARWSANPDQALVVLTVVAEQVCPDVAATHIKQVAAKRKADAAAARRRAAAAAKKALRERRALLAQQQAEQQAQQPVSVYYANCTEVEAAGAAPIHTGDPGYSRDLDRDGDGVACEQ